MPVQMLSWSTPEAYPVELEAASEGFLSSSRLLCLFCWRRGAGVKAKAVNDAFDQPVNAVITAEAGRTCAQSALVVLGAGTDGRSAKRVQSALPRSACRLRRSSGGLVLQRALGLPQTLAPGSGLLEQGQHRQLGSGAAWAGASRNTGTM